MIYFVQAADGSSPIKIGFTGNLDARLKQLEHYYGRPLALLHTLEGGPTEEAEIHERFAHLRMGRTEQFVPGPDLMQFIGRPLFVNQGDIPLMGARTLLVRLSDEAIKWARIASGYTGESMSGYLNRILIEKAQQDVERLYAQAKEEKGGAK